MGSSRISVSPLPRCRSPLQQEDAAGHRGTPRGSGRFRDVLTELIHARDDEGQLSDAEVVGHASVIYAASHETTGNALTWALFLLSQHPQWHRAACEEVRSTLTSDAPTLAELERLEVLDAVLRETLRLTPAAPWTTRIASTHADVGGHSVPRGTEIILSIFHTTELSPVMSSQTDLIHHAGDISDPTSSNSMPSALDLGHALGAASLCLKQRLCWQWCSGASEWNSTHDGQSIPF